MADDAAMDVESRMPPEPTATEGPSPQEPPKPKDIERAESVEGEVGKNRVLVKVMLLDGLHCLLNCTVRRERVRGEKEEREEGR